MQRFALALVVILSLAPSVYVDIDTEKTFVTQVNDTRASQGLTPLAMDPGLQAQAQTHTASMIAAGKVWEPSGPSVFALGGSVSSIMAAWMASPGHRATILGNFGLVGVATDTLDGVLYVTVLFGGSAPTTTTSTTLATTFTEGEDTLTERETGGNEAPGDTETENIAPRADSVALRADYELDQTEDTDQYSVRRPGFYAI